MFAVSPEFLEAAAGTADVISRVTILGPDLLPLDTVGSFEVPVDEASAQVRVDGRSIIRRTATLTVENDDGLYNPDPAGLLWWSQPWLLESGLYVGGAIEWVPVVTGYPDEPEQTDDGKGGRLVVPFRDRLKLADGSTFTRPATYSGASRVADLVRILCEDAGMGVDDALYDLDDGGAQLVVDHTYEGGRRRLEVLDQLRTDHALDLYCTPLGVVTLRPVIDPNLAPVAASYQRGAGIPLLGIRKRWTPLIRNRSIVVGEDVYGDPIRAEVADTNPDSPYSVQNIGDRPADEYVSLGITTQEQAFRVAVARLPTLALIEEAVDVAVPLNPAHEGGDIIELVDGQSSTAGRHILDSFVIGTSPGAAGALTTRKVRPLA